MSVICDRLQDALEKGDVAELEVAITAAQSALEDNVYRSGPRGATSGKLGGLLAKAKDAFLGNLEECKSYLKPLRKACRQLDERAIFDALVRTQSAPQRIQLYMYTDIRRAEELREGIVAAHEQAIRLLDSTNWQLIDTFLNEKASVLEDRTVLALVQRREDLLRGDRVATSKSRASTAPWDGGLGTHGPSAAHEASAISSSSNFLARHESDSEVAEYRASPVEEPESAPLSLTEANDPFVERGQGSGGPFRPAWRSMGVAGLETSSPSPHHAATGGSFSLRPIIAAEAESRANVVARETRDRVGLYKDVIRGDAAIASVRASGGFDGDSSENGYADEGINLLHESHEDDGDERRRIPSLAQRKGQPHLRPAPAPLPSGEVEEDGERLPEPRTAPPPRASLSPLERETVQQKSLSLPLSSVLRKATAPHARTQQQGLSPQRQQAGTPTRSRHNRVVAVGREREPERAATAGLDRPSSLPPRHSHPSTGASAAVALGRRGHLREHPTPNLSPIRDVNGTLTSDREDRAVLDVSGLPTATWRDGNGIIRPPPDVNETAVTPNQSPRFPGSTLPNSGASASATATATPRSYESRRIDVLLRGTLEEEDLRRRDIEGTEDFDRCVVLHPMAARIDMLKRSLRERQRLLSQ